MKVIYKKTILEKIVEEIYKAKEQNKEIEKIVLTQGEYLELKDSWYFRGQTFPGSLNKRAIRLLRIIQIMGVEIEVEI